MAFCCLPELLSDPNSVMISLYRYQIPFRQPFVTAKGTFVNREGILISFESERITSLCEAAPLPGYSSETLPDAEELLMDHLQELDHFLISGFDSTGLRNFLDSLPGIPSVQFALSAMGIDILVQSGRSTLFDLFGRNAAPQSKINTVIGSVENDQLLKEIESGYKRGFKTIKIKSVYETDRTIEKLADTLKTAVNKFPDILFRIDANQSWPMAGFPQQTELLNGLNVEYIEEPVSIKSIEDYPDIIRSSSLPVALDESISDPDNLRTALADMPETVVIIKPMVLGNIFRVHETISAQRGLLNDVVVTTALESAVGRYTVASVASISGDSERAHGLDTGRLFEKDLHSGPQVSNGVLAHNRPFRSLKLSDLDLNLITKIV
jgi:o-succinylbenzoate synthase